MRLSCSGIRPAQSADFTSTIFGYVSMILPSIPGRTNHITEDMETTILLHSPKSKHAQIKYDITHGYAIQRKVCSHQYTEFFVSLIRII